MKILHILPMELQRRSLGGIHTYVLGLASAQHDAGHTVSIAAHGPSSRPREASFPSDTEVAVAELGETLAFGRTRGLARRLMKALRLHSPDVVHIHGTLNLTSDLAALLAAHRSTPVLQSPHGALLQRDIQKRKPVLKYVYLRALRKMLDQGVTLHFLSEAERAASWIPDPSYKTVVTSPGLTPQACSASTTPILPNGVPLESDYYLFLARINRRKGFDLLLEAYTRLLRTKPSLPPLVIAGHPEEPELLKQPHDLKKGENLAGKIIYLGELNDEATKWSVLCRARMVLAPSRWESFGYTVLEAGFAGVPVAFGDAGLMFGEWSKADVILRLETRSETKFTESLDRALSMPDHELNLQATRAKKYFETRYSWRAAEQSLSREYERLVRE